MRRIVILQGHPDPTGGHLGHALVQSYRQAAEDAGHEVRMLSIAELDFPLLRTQQDFNEGEAPEVIASAQADIAWADHILISYPLWLGDMPAVLKGFLEQTLRPGFATSKVEKGSHWERCLKGKSARVIVTMGMPALVYRWFYGAHSLKSLKRNILGFCGVRPVRHNLFGLVEVVSEQKRQGWLDQMQGLGRKAL
jgi:putative NADPH-quinone reductase